MSLLPKFALASFSSILILAVGHIANAQMTFPSNPSEVSNQVLVEIKSTSSMTAADFARSNGLNLYRSLVSDPKMGVLNFSSVSAASSALQILRQNSNVKIAGFNIRPKYQEYVIQRYAFVPNDTSFSSQWHFPLIFVDEPWKNNLTGSRVTVGIVDDGLQKLHEDLAPNYRGPDSYDFRSRDLDPTPVDDDDNHGTAVAGIVAARGGNKLGVTGVAPYANLAGLRVGFGGTSTVADFVDAVRYHSGRNLISVKNHSYGISDPYIDDSLQSRAFDDSTLQGTIHVLASGNQRPFFITSRGVRVDLNPSSAATEDANKSMIQRNPNVITVGATNEDGSFAYYSSYGACLSTAAPATRFAPSIKPDGSVTVPDDNGIVTTDRTGDFGYDSSNYFTGFEGTSASAPVVSGIIALAKQANPKANARTIKHLLAATSTKNDPSNFEWQQNAARVWFNPNYGFGMINAEKLTALAGVKIASPEATSLLQIFTQNAPVASGATVSKNFLVRTTQAVEAVEIYLSIDGVRRGNISGTIISPSGTTSIFCASNTSDIQTTPIAWWYTSNAFWGENPAGQWTVTIRNTGANGVAFWRSGKVKIHSGTLLNAPPPDNDRFANPENLSGTEFGANGNNVLCTSEIGEPAHAGIPARKSLWYRWTAPKTGSVLLKTEGSAIDTDLAVYTGTSLAGLRPIKSNNDYLGDTFSVLKFDATAGVAYLIAVDAATGPGGLISLSGGYIPNVTIVGADIVASEPGRDVGIIRIRRQSSFTLPLNLRYTISGSARNGTDYAAVAAKGQLEPGKIVFEILGQVTDDAEKESTESMVVTLLPSIEYNIIGPTTAAIQIYDND